MDTLNKTATALDIRLDVLKVPRSKVPIEAWNEYEQKYPGVVPTWYKNLLSDFAFIDVFLDLPHWDDESWAANFEFRSPSDEFFDTEDDDDITSHGWFPFAEESDGNLWAIKANADQDSPIILIDHSGGGLESDGGVYYAAHNLSHLLATASISFGRKEHLKSDGYVDESKAGYRLWGQADTHLESLGVEDAKELLKR